MRFTSYLWNADNTRHVERNGVTVDQFMDVVEAPEIEHRDADHDERWVAYGPTDDRYVACVYTLIDAETVYPITAFKSSPKRAKRRRPR